MKEEKEISVMEGDSVTLNTGRTEMDYNEIHWNFGLTNVLIARISVKKDTSEVYDAVLDGRFKQRLKLDHQTGSLIITNTRNEHSEMQLIISVFADSDAVKSVSVMEGDSVSLQTNSELQTEDEIINRLKLDHQTGSLTITNTRSTHSGLYGVEIIRNRTVTTYRFNLHADYLSVMEGDSVSLQTNSELQTEDEITWTFGHSETRIADINTKHRIFSTFDVLDGRFRNRLKLDHQTGSLIITNSRTTDSGLYQVTIISSMRQITNRFNLTVSGESQLHCHLCCWSSSFF
uniref:Immunoglobulin domain-containing protein n=1 Tax=Sinocyclocheilus anshuiensis TaxID=1608454 RepID=A0A671K7D1_9TELE